MKHKDIKRLEYIIAHDGMSNCNGELSADDCPKCPLHLRYPDEKFNKACPTDKALEYAKRLLFEINIEKELGDNDD